MKIKPILLLLNILFISNFGFGQKSEWSLFVKANYPTMDIQDDENLNYVFVNTLSPNEIFGISEPFDITRSTKRKLGIKIGIQNQLQISPRCNILTGFTFKLIQFESTYQHSEIEWNWNNNINFDMLTVSMKLFDESGNEFLRDDLYRNVTDDERLQKMFYVDIPIGLQFTIVPNEWSVHGSIFYSRLFHANFEGVESEVYKDRILYKKNLIGWEVGTSFRLANWMTFLIDYSIVPSNIYSNKNPFSANSIPHPKGEGLTEISVGLSYQFN